MIYCAQLLFFFSLYLFLYYQIRDMRIRKWSGLVFLAAGLALMVWLPYRMPFFSTPVISTGTFVIGLGLFVSQNKYRRIKPALYLSWRGSRSRADDFPFDSQMQQLLSLLDEEIGLSKYNDIGLDTAINLDLGCDKYGARYLLKALRQDFGTDFSDYQPWRYFPRSMFDRLLRTRGRRCVDSVPLTIGMLYQAIKARRWDTRTLERL